MFNDLHKKLMILEKLNGNGSLLMNSGELSYSVYGPMEDSSRLIPVLCKKTVDGKLPEFGSKDISRDFLSILGK